MSEAKSKWQRGLFWTSIVCGGICLLLVAGYFGGKQFYRKAENTGRPGFELWSRFYQRFIFIEADTVGYRYSDIQRDITMNLTLAYFDAFADRSDEGVSTFTLPDGKSVTDFLCWQKDFQLEPEIGRLYKVTWRLDLVNNSTNPFIIDDELEWFLEGVVLDVEEVSGE